MCYPTPARLSLAGSYLPALSGSDVSKINVVCVPVPQGNPLASCTIWAPASAWDPLLGAIGCVGTSPRPDVNGKPSLTLHQAPQCSLVGDIRPARLAEGKANIWD